MDTWKSDECWSFYVFLCFSVWEMIGLYCLNCHGNVCWGFLNSTPGFWMYYLLSVGAVLPSCSNAPINMIYMEMDFPIGHNSMNQELWDPSSLVHKSMTYKIMDIVIARDWPTYDFHFLYKTCLSGVFSYMSCLTVRLEFPLHSSLPASMKEQPYYYTEINHCRDQWRLTIFTLHCTSIRSKFCPFFPMDIHIILKGNLGIWVVYFYLWSSTPGGTLGHLDWSITNI